MYWDINRETNQTRPDKQLTKLQPFITKAPETRNTKSLPNQCHDNETRLLLAAPSTAEKMMVTQSTPYGVYFVCGKSYSLGKNVPVPWMLKVFVQTGQAGHRRATPKLCLSMVELSFKNPASQKRYSRSTKEPWEGLTTTE